MEVWQRWDTWLTWSMLGWTVVVGAVHYVVPGNRREQALFLSWLVADGLYVGFLLAKMVLAHPMQ
jgi:hypothetical protein